MIMGTVGILRSLRTYWKNANHPLYRRQEPPQFVPPANQSNEPVRLSRIILVSMLLIAGTLCSIAGFFGLLLLIGIVLFLWPILVTLPTSSIIAGEREARTWDILLMTPFDWQDLLLAKTASRLRDRQPFMFVFLWILGNITLIALTTSPNSISGGGSVTQTLGIGETLTCLMLPFLIGFMYLTGMQEYVIAALVGLLISLFAPGKELARAAAALFALGLAVANALLVALIVQNAGNILSPLPLTLRWVIAGVTLGLILLLRETAIILMFRYLSRHLGDSDLHALRWFGEAEVRK